MENETDIAVVIDGEPETTPATQTETQVSVQPERSRDPTTGQFVKQTAQEPADDLAEQFKAMEAEKAQAIRDRDAARGRAADFERIARESSQREHQSRAEIIATQADSIAAGIAAAEAEIAAAKKAIRTAKDTSDYDAEVEAIDLLSSAKAKLLRLDEARAEVETHKARIEREPQRREQVARTEPPADPVEAFLSTRTEATQKWLRDHPEHARAIAMNAVGRASTEESRKAAKLAAADQDAVAEGFERDSNEYFAHVEKFIGLKKEASNGAPKDPPRRKPAVPVAPVNAAAGGGTNGGGTEVRLSAKEATAAQDGTHTWAYDDPSPQKKFRKGDPIGVQEFARRKLALQKQGAYDRSYTDQ